MDRRIFFTLSFAFSFCNGEPSYLDIAELSSFQYSIDISNQPVLLDETKEKDGILLSSKHGQRYQCQFESLSQFSQKVKEEEENASKISVVELLQPMEGKPCLISTTGWWTYEFCYKKNIKQYHVSAEHKIVGDVLSLGSYSEEFDWSANHKKMPEVTQRYHSQQYVNGSVCDLTGATRSAEVRFKCKEGSMDFLDGVEEPSTCRYLVHVSTSRACGHPSLRPVPERKSLPITCSPVLSGAELSDYNKLKEKRRREEAEEEEERKKGKGDGEGKRLKTGDDASDFDLSDLEKSGEVDTATDGFGFLEIGSTKIKFYVLNYESMLEEMKKETWENRETADSESSSTSPQLEESSSSSKMELTGGGHKDAGASKSTEQQDNDDNNNKKDDNKSDDNKSDDNKSDNKAIVGKEEEEDEDESADTKEFMEIYKRLLSNRKLKSFVGKRIRSPHSSQDDSHQQPQQQQGEAAGASEGGSKGEGNAVEGTGRPEDGKEGEERGKVSGEKEEVEPASQKVSDESAADSENRREEKAGGGGGDEGRAEESKEGLDSTSSLMETSSDDGTRAEVHVIGELFKKGSPITSEHRSIHHMIMAIIKQTDRSSKEAIRHEAIEKNYEFDWKKQKEQLRSSVKDDEMKTTTTTQENDGNNKISDEL